MSKRRTRSKLRVNLSYTGVRRFDGPSVTCTQMGMVDRKSTAMSVCATDLAGAIASLFFAEQYQRVDGERALRWNPRSQHTQRYHS